MSIHDNMDMSKTSSMIKNPQEYAVSLRYDQNLKAERSIPFYIKIYETRTNTSITDLEPDHERLLHFFLVREDLEQFMHLHPELRNGTFQVNPVFPTGGNWTAVVEWKYHDQLYYQNTNLFVAGNTAAIQPDFSKEKTVDNYKVRLETQPPHPVSGQETQLLFRIEDANGKQIDDLQDYLGALMHITVWDKEFAHFGHPHAERNKERFPRVHRQDPVAMYVFPTVGQYKIWAQFKHNDQVHTVDYWIDVQS